MSIPPVSGLQMRGGGRLGEEPSSDEGSTPAEAEGETSSASTRTHLSWAQLLQRVFAIDMAVCFQCGGPVTYIATIEEPTVMTKILAPLGLPTKAPPRSPAQAYPLPWTARSHLNSSLCRNS